MCKNSQFHENLELLDEIEAADFREKWGGIDKSLMNAYQDAYGKIQIYLNHSSVKE